MTSLPKGPFVLLDDQSGGSGRALLFAHPREIVETRDPDQVSDCLAGLEGHHAAGFVSYEAGHALEPKLAPLRRSPPADEPPLLWFGLFDAPEEVDAAALLPDPAGAWAAAPRPLVARADYLGAVDRILDHIFAGNIYQANLTFPCDVPFAGHPLALYASLRARSRAAFGAVVFTGAHWILSASPELFFKTDGRQISARPMKGTAPRCTDPETLRSDPKQRAENLMIVDLIRNDLSRVSSPGTVKVPSLFEIETYPTLHQMTSTVTADIEGEASPARLLAALFPCGSVTGAPKIRAQEIVAEVEPLPRGVYTGAIGRVAPGGEALFNVAIRTLVVAEGGSVARLGLGSGIVADSRPADEWRECLAKGAFVTDPARSFDLVETMRFDPADGMPELERHLARLRRSADALGFAFDRHDARNELQAATFRLPAPSRVRLLLSPSGAIAIEIRPLPPAPHEPVAVALAPRPLPAHDFRLAHKTADRSFYDAPRAAAGTFEIVFEDEAGFLTEGSFTNLFVERGGKLLTPPLSRGLLPGVLRQRLIDEGAAEEADLVAADLARGFLVGNALRGLGAVRGELDEAAMGSLQPGPLRLAGRYRELLERFVRLRLIFLGRRRHGLILSGERNADARFTPPLRPFEPRRKRIRPGAPRRRRRRPLKREFCSAPVLLLGEL
jgi:para-aminobenzoate synthetase/4-amino-4-deoxychorismate lyase